MSRYSDLSELRGELASIDMEREEIRAKLQREADEDECDKLRQRLDDLAADAAPIEVQIEDIECDLASAERASDRADYHRRVL